MLKQHRKNRTQNGSFFFLNFSEIHILGYFSVFFHQQQPASHQYHTQHSKISSYHFHFSSKYNPAASFRIVYAQWLKTRHWIRSSYEILLMTSFKLTRTMSTQKIFLKTFVAWQAGEMSVGLLLLVMLLLGVAAAMLAAGFSPVWKWKWDEKRRGVLLIILRQVSKTEVRIWRELLNEVSVHIAHSSQYGTCLVNGAADETKNSRMCENLSVDSNEARKSSEIFDKLSSNFR